MNTDATAYLIEREKAYAARAFASLLADVELLKERKSLKRHHLSSLQNSTKELHDSLLKIEALEETQP